MAKKRERWLLVTLFTGGSSTLRVRCWRRLRGLGALYLQNSVCLLPERPETTTAVSGLLESVNQDGGSGEVVSIVLADAADEQRIIERFCAERTDEYSEICARTPALLEEIAMERARGRATYTEVEESEADLDRMRSWLRRVRARDYFGAEGAAEAQAAVEECAAALAEFEREAVARELADDAGE